MRPIFHSPHCSPEINLDADPVGAAAMLVTGAVCQAVMKLCRAFRLRGEVR
jgi:hypothetical protein